MSLATLLHPKILRYSPSPNYDERPQGASIDTVIIHYTDFLTCEESLACLTDASKKVSAHFLIDEQGEIYQLVDPYYRAWHAGVSAWQDRENINHYSIGIELQNGGMTYYQKFQQWQPYPHVQMQALVDLIHALKCFFPLCSNLILGHCAIAPDRKIDPGPHFDWKWIKSKIKFK